MANYFELYLYYSTTEPETTDISALSNETIFVRAIHPYTAVETEMFKTPKLTFSNTKMTYKTFSVDLKPFNFNVDENDEWNYTTYSTIMGILNDNQYLYLVSDITPESGAVYPIAWNASDGSAERFVLTSISTEEGTGTINVTLEGQGNTFEVT